MEFDLQRYLAVLLGYVVPIALWFVVSRRVPVVWPVQPEIELKRPKASLWTALAAVLLIILLNIAYNQDLLIPSNDAGWLGKLAFVANLAIIWSPLALALLWRREGLGTCLLSPRGLVWKVAWGLVGSVLGVAVFLLVLGRADELGLAVTLLGRFDPIKALQSFIQFFAVGYLLVRIVKVAGPIAGIGICAALYGLVKYPYYMGSYGMSFMQASGLIAFSIVVAFAVVAIIHDRRDVLVMAIIHVFLDLVQNV